MAFAQAGVALDPYHLPLLRRNLLGDSGQKLQFCFTAYEWCGVKPFALLRRNPLLTLGLEHSKERLSFAFPFELEVAQRKHFVPIFDRIGYHCADHHLACLRMGHQTGCHNGFVAQHAVGAPPFTAIGPDAHHAIADPNLDRADKRAVRGRLAQRQPDYGGTYHVIIMGNWGAKGGIEIAALIARG